MILIIKCIKMLPLTNNKNSRINRKNNLKKNVFLKKVIIFLETSLLWRYLEYRNHSVMPWIIISSNKYRIYPVNLITNISFNSNSKSENSRLLLWQSYRDLMTTKMICRNAPFNMPTWVTPCDTRLVKYDNSKTIYEHSV